MGARTDRGSTRQLRRRSGQCPNLRKRRRLRRLLRASALTSAKTPLKVCLLTTGHDAISGGHRYHQHLAADAPAANVEFSVVAARWRLRLPRADVVLIDSLHASRALLAVRRTHRPWAVGVVHQHPGGAPPSDWHHRVRRHLDIATYRACDMLITPGPIVTELLINAYGFDRGRIETIEPGSDLPLGEAIDPLRGGSRLGLLNVANWLPNKGILELLDAVAATRPGDTRLHLAGRGDIDPTYTSAVHRRIGQPDLRERVVVHGPIAATDVASLCAAADAFAWTSAVETYGSAVSEALALGIPVVGWRTPHLCRLVTHEVDGLLVEFGRVDQLADAIHRLAVDANEQQRLAVGARTRGSHLPTWNQTTNRFFEVLTRLAAETVEPSHHSSGVVEVDPAHAPVLDEQMVRHRGGNAAQSHPIAALIKLT